ncbi:MAG TPA: type II secretion system F family protein [Planctomycetota bacterium]|nr:type II secretion system F family protein [Planctomycetota bacterium]
MAAPLKHLTEFFHALSVQLDAGITIHDALQAHAKSLPGGRLRSEADHWCDVLARGGTWSEGLKQSGKFLPPGTAEIIEAGETTGRLSQCCKLLAEDFEQRIKLSRSLMALSWYPALILVLALGLGCLMTFLNPFGTMTAQFQHQSKAKVEVDNQHKGWLFVTVVCVTGVGAIATAITLRVTLPHYWYGLLPLNPRLAWRQSSLQFLRTWHMAAAGGLLADRSLALAGQSIQHPGYRRQIQRIAAQVGAEHRPPSEFLGPSGFLDRTEITQIVTMEKTGAVDETLKRMADQATERFTRSLKLWIAFLVGLLVVCVVGYVLYIVIMFALGYAGMLKSAGEYR